MSEQDLIKTLLQDESYGWIGWTTLVAVVVTVALGFITKALLQVVKNVKSIRAEATKPDYKKQIKCESNINELLRTIKHDMHADAVMILQYHNGVHSIANNSLLRISATHESITQMSPSYLGVVDGWMANFFGNWNNMIFDGRYIAIENFNNEEFDQDLRGLQQWLAKIHCKSIYLFPVQDAYGATFGIGVLCHTTKAVEHSAEFLSLAKGRFHAIGALLAGGSK
ncbi:hypothetical protein [Thiomicrorhabdus sp.]|uniref:hypothetical protein n=1 Tax=Thiomicrorhabdus sp. TaxID=2039724 RepID=UPI0029C96BF6|nr:hypothetical protein [Thiomicrorhabdus sp.]